MSHMVIYRGADGKPGYHQTDDIHDAVMYVESLRNDKDVDHARIFRLEEVTFEYRPYYRVEINTGNAPAVAASSNGVDESGDSSDDDDVMETTEVDDDHDGDDVADDDASADDDDDLGEADDDDINDDEAPAAGARRGLFGR